MKNKFQNIIKGFSLCLVFLPTTFTIAQQVAPTANKPESPVQTTPIPVDYTGIKNLTNTGYYNYTRTVIPDAPFQTLPSGNGYLFRMNTEYYDGLGRPLQTVNRKGHADGSDLVGVHTYDILGRETYKYLPYAAPTGGINANSSTGTINLNDSTQLRGFYDENGPDEQPFSKTYFDNSPLNRTKKIMAPGQSWVGSERGKEYKYKTNSDPSYNQSSTEVYVSKGCYPHFTIGEGIDDLPTYAGNYEIGQLFITKVTDEDGKISEEIKDKDGKIIMKRNLFQRPTGTFEIVPTNYAYTHYVYNDLGQLRAVIPPAAIQPYIASYGTSFGTITTYTTTYSWPSPNVDQFNGLCYAYIYDKRGRNIERRIPGKEIEYYVYDIRDRQVLFQDGNLRAKSHWAFTIYDALDRPIETGTSDLGSLTRTKVQSKIDDASSYSTDNILYYLKNYALYHNYPSSLTNCTQLTVTYYDDYSQLTGFLDYDGTVFNGITLPSNNSVVPSILTMDVKGKSTWSKVRILLPDDPNTELWLKSVSYYDANGRVIQTASENLNTGTDRTSNIYYFQGMLYENIIHHINPAAIAMPGTTDPALHEYTIINTFERNIKNGGGNDKISKHTQKINNGLEYEIAINRYDHMGRNTLKQWTAGLSLNEYNITGAINHIAFRNYDQDTLFDENLYYDKGFKSKLYNGNVAGTIWSGFDHRKKAYGYNYDELNRLTHAEFNQFNTGTNAWDKLEDYDYTASSITYDLNGNIKTMNQMGRAPFGSSILPIDVLTYTYSPNSNLLLNVKDAGYVEPTLPDFKDDENNNPVTAEEFHYDPNGNMNIDENKGISSITYNYLNKPEKVTINNKGSISYTYDAAGTMLRKKTLDAVTGIQEIWDYFGGIVYKDNVLQYILNEEGRARPVLFGHANDPNIPDGQLLTKYVYDYFVKDHIGNVRSTITSKPNAANYAAKHNISTANIEELVFDNITAVRDTKPGSTNPDDMAARLNAAEADRRIGTAIMLKTNPGDHFTINVNAFYDGDYSQDDQQVSSGQVVDALMGTLIGGVSSTPGTGDLKGNQELIRNIFSNPRLVDQMDQIINTTNDPNAPKAHLNWLWFNDKLELQAANSGSVQVHPTPGNWINIDNTTNLFGGGVVNDCGCVQATGPGFLVVYIDNQSIGKDVWFDNLSLNQYSSELLEEDHYYPFGLTVSTTTPDQPETANPYKLTTKELDKKFDINSYDFGARQYDMTLGRWRSSDPLAEQTRRWSPYVYALDNPIRFIDLDGMSASDFYNLNAEKVKHVDDGSNDKKLVLTTSKKQDKVDDAMNKGAIVNVPTDAAVTQMSDAFDKSEKSGKENGFVIGEQGKTSATVEGSKGKIEDAEWDKMKADLTSQGDIGSTDVHTHTSEKDAYGDIVTYGRAEPSSYDQDNQVYPKSNQAEIVLGYFLKRTPPRADEIGGQPTSEYIKSIGFYNFNGLIHSGTTIYFSDFKKTVNKINKQ